MLGAYPLWWLLGLGSLALMFFGAVMIAIMVRRGGLSVPRGSGCWLLFLLLMCVSVIGIDSPGRLIGFVYRAFLYFTVTAAFIYVYNARVSLTTRYVLGVIAAFWGATVVGGYASIMFPTFSFYTPLHYVLPAGLQSNELVGEMVERRMTQHNPDSWFDLAPRPSAPFLYTNQWGNVYSLALPMVLAYLYRFKKSERGLRFWVTLLAIPLSFVPALLTLNRGMFLGLAVGALYLLVRFVQAGRSREITLIAVVGGCAAVTTAILGIQSRLEKRVTTSSSTEDRATLYKETVDRTLESPLFGYGGPRPSVTEGLPSVGTQGHVWTVMFSFGIPALLFFMATLVGLVIATRRVRSVSQLLVHAVQVITVVEVLYYGVLPNGLVLSFIAAALLLRSRNDTIDDGSHASLRIAEREAQERPRTSQKVVAARGR